MSNQYLRRFVTAVAAVAAFQSLLITPAPANAAPVFDEVVVFGDSLSDPGNLFVLTGQFGLRPFTPIPSAPYAIGGFHFTNGETWAERLSRALGSSTGAGPALRVPHLYRNYAFGGARARASGGSASPNLAAQVGMYLGAASSAADSADLYIVWLGANDVRDALEALATDPTGATSFGIIQAAITAIGNNIFTLWGAGARTFLVPNVPNLAITPAVAAQSAQVRAIAAQLSGAYNAALAQLLNTLSGQLPDTVIARLDVFALLNGIIAAPSAYGITNVVEPCLHFGVIAQPFCAQPRQYLFWDAIHPTATVHGILAERAVAALAP